MFIKILIFICKFFKLFAGLLLFKFPESFIKKGKTQRISFPFFYIIKLLRFKGTSMQHVAIVSILGELVSSLGKKKKNSHQIVKIISTDLNAEGSMRTSVVFRFFVFGFFVLVLLMENSYCCFTNLE